MGTYSWKRKNYSSGISQTWFLLLFCKFTLHLKMMNKINRKYWQLKLLLFHYYFPSYSISKIVRQIKTSLSVRHIPGIRVDLVYSSFTNVLHLFVFKRKDIIGLVWLLAFDDYSPYDYKLAVTSMGSRCRFTCTPVHLFCSFALRDYIYSQAW